MSTDKAQEALDEIRAREQAATPGPWRIEFDSCDCGDGHGCSHGTFPYAITTSRSHTERKPGEEHPSYDFSHSEISELGDEDIDFITAARADVPRLLAAVDAAGALADGWDAPAERGPEDSATAFAIRSIAAEARQACAGELRAAILAALTGTGDSRG